MLKAILILITIVGIFSQAANNITDVNNSTANITDNSTINNQATKDEPFNSYSQFNQYIAQFGKQYETIEEFGTRFINFQNNSAHISNLNLRNTEDNLIFAHTQFSDMHPTDFKSQYLTFVPDAESLARAQTGGYFNSKNSTALPPVAPHRNLKGGEKRNLQTAPLSYDWRTYGVVGAIKNQGACGSCWTFASVANIESLYAIKHGYLYNLSEQQLMDCVYTNSGCNGGAISNAFSYIETSYGLETTYNYGAYLAYQSYCRSNSGLGLARVTGWYFPGTDETYIKSYLWSNGPVAIAINATPLQYYSSGIINLSSYYCDPTNLDHTVLIVGYGTSNGLDYWIVKNSWGPYFGESGYFRIVRGYGVCGLNRYVITAVVA